jgi:hypothetical protein
MRRQRIFAAFFIYSSPVLLYYTYMAEKPILNIIYTNIGRGHPYYVDGIIEQLRRHASDRIKFQIKSVFGLSRGKSKALWHLARILYYRGSQGGAIGKLYGAIRRRRRIDRRGLAENMMARDLRDYISRNRYPTLVAHPLLAGFIADLVPTYYQHGEIAVPPEAVVKGIDTVFVPTPESAARFEGRESEVKVLVSGLCIESDLVKMAERCYSARLGRLESEGPLTGAFFSSGAEPIDHLKKIIEAVASLSGSGYPVFIICREGGRLIKMLARIDTWRFVKNDADLEKGRMDIGPLVIVYRDRDSLNRLTVRIFEHFDYIVGPSHERTNWAVGLGLPLFILHPLIGTFAPLNRDFMTNKKVAWEIRTEAEASKFVDILNRHRQTGRLAKAARNGFGGYDINGFEKIAHHLAEKLL